MDVDDRDEALNLYLQRLRREAGLSVPQVCERTKIQERYVVALEEARFGELPSNTHLRAFSLALAQAEGGNSERTALLVRRVLNAVAAPGTTVPDAAPAAKARPMAHPAPLAVPARPLPAAPLAAAVALPRTEVVAEAAQAAEGLVQGASQRLRALPWQALLALAGGAALLSGGLLWGVHLWQQRLVSAPLASADAPGAVASTQPGAAAVEASTANSASATAESGAPVAATNLVLRARRPCWLVLEVDGQRLPTVTMQDGDKRSWPVHQKAVLLAGNLGALRVWWRGDNLGYLGELGSRANGLVFEPGHGPRTDKALKLALPAGVPE